jgi:uncharacterized Zn-binding protein involved in type VI secretion
MRLPTVAGSRATCNHIATGNPKVRFEGIPVSVVGESTAGGIILGPGSPKVLVQGRPVSVVSDAVAPHGKSRHSAALTTTISTGRVLVP